MKNLAKVLRKAGLNVIEIDGWKKRSIGRNLPFLGPKGILAHHTGTPASAFGNYPSLNVVTNGRADLKGPLANLGLGRDGTWYVIAKGVCNHAGPVDDIRYSNDYALGIEAEHPGVGPWPKVQYESYVAGVAALCTAFNVSVRGHKEAAIPYGRKPDPNFNMNTFRADVKDLQEGLDMAISKKALQKMIRSQSRNAWLAEGAAKRAKGILHPKFIKAFEPWVRKIIREELGK